MAISNARSFFAPRIPERILGPLLLIARLCLGFEFMLFGIRKFLHPDHIATIMSDHGIPGVLIWAVIPFQFCFGWMIAFGVQTRIASLALCWFCIVAPSIFHTHNLDNWARDIAAAGGWIFLAMFGPGPWSLDARLNLRGQKILEPSGPDSSRAALALAAGRLLMALYFIVCGARDATLTGPIASYFGHDAPVVMSLAAAQIIFGSMILLGWHARLASAVLAIYALTLGLTIHSPATELGLFRSNETLALFGHGLFEGMGSMIGSYGKDIAVFGAMLVLFVNGPGPLSLDAKARHGAVVSGRRSIDPAPGK